MGHIMQGLRTQGFFCLNVCNGLFNITPVCVLCKDGANSNFKGRVPKRNELLFYFIFGINTPWLAAFVIPAKAGIQRCKVLRGFGFPINRSRE